MTRVKYLTRLAKEGFWVGLGQVLAVLSALGSVKVLTELLSPSQYGEFVIGLTIAGLANQVLFGPLSNGLTRFYAPASERDQLGDYLEAGRLLAQKVTLWISIFTLMLIIGLWVVQYQHWWRLIFLSLLFAILTGYSSLISGVQNGARNRVLVAVYQGSEGWLRILFALILLIACGAGSNVALLGFCIGSFCAVTLLRCLLPPLFRQGVATRERELHWRREILIYSKPFGIWGIFAWIQLSADRWALGFFGGLEDVAAYNVLLQLGYAPMLMGSSFLMQLVGPIVFHTAGDGKSEDRNAYVDGIILKVIFYVGGGALFLCIGTLFTHRLIFRIFTNEVYLSYSHLLPWIILGGGLFAAGQALALALLSRMASRALLLPKVLTSIIGALTMFLGAFLYGVAGVVVGVIFFGAMYLLAVALVVRKFSVT